MYEHDMNEDALTLLQREALNMLAYEDQHTVARRLDIDLAVMAQWETQPAFRDAVRQFEDNLRESLCREIVFEANRLFNLYCGLQEHMTLNQRVDFLADLSKALSTVARSPEKDGVQDTSDLSLLDLDNFEIDNDERSTKNGELNNV